MHRITVPALLLAASLMLPVTASAAGLAQPMTARPDEGHPGTRVTLAIPGVLPRGATIAFTGGQPGVGISTVPAKIVREVRRGKDTIVQVIVPRGAFEGAVLVMLHGWAIYQADFDPQR